MFCESLETRRFLTVTLRPPIPPGPSGEPGTQAPDCVVVTQDCYGNVTIKAKDTYNNWYSGKKKHHFLSQWKKDSYGKWNYGKSSCGGSTRVDDDCALGVAIIEDNGTLVVTEISTGATWDVTNAKSIKVYGTDNNDSVFYTGNTKGAYISTGYGVDDITVADTGSGSSDVYSGSDNDSVNLLIGNYTFVDAGSGNDTIYVNSGGGIYNTAAGEAIIECGSGNDTVVMYAGKAWIDGEYGTDVVLLLGGTASVSSASVQS